MRVVGIDPVASQVLVEMLDDQEALGTKLFLGKRRSSEMPPQAYILKLGPALGPAKWGFNVGDRVILQGNFVPLPKLDPEGRDLGMVEPHCIKAVLREEDD